MLEASLLTGVAADETSLLEAVELSVDDDEVVDTSLLETVTDPDDEEDAGESLLVIVALSVLDEPEDTSLLEGADSDVDEDDD